MAVNLSIFRMGARSLIGVDISSFAIKMVELTSASGGMRIDRYAIEPISRHAVSEGNIANIEEVTEAVKRCWQRLGSSTKQVALALPSSAVIMKKITLPSGLPEAELEAQVQSEANQYIPFAIDEVNLDFQVIGPSPTNSDDVEVMIAASRKEKVEDRVACIEGAGLKATVVDVESNAIINAFELIAPHSGDAPVALVGIGMNVMNLTAVRAGEAIFSREQAFGGAQLTNEIMRVYGMSYDEADQAKINNALPVNYESEVLAPFLENLALEITRALQFFFTSSPFSEVGQIVLYGGCSILPGIVELVEEKNQTRVVVANAFASMGVGAKVRQKQLAIDAPMLLTACGLALRRFDP